MTCNLFFPLATKSFKKPISLKVHLFRPKSQKFWKVTQQGVTMKKKEDTLQ